VFGLWAAVCVLVVLAGYAEEGDGLVETVFFWLSLSKLVSIRAVTGLSVDPESMCCSRLQKKTAYLGLVVGL